MNSGKFGIGTRIKLHYYPVVNLDLQTLWGNI